MSKAGISSVEANRQYFNIDWRVKRPVFDEQMAYFCMKEEMADVEFVFYRNNKITVGQPTLLFYLYFDTLEDFCSQICACYRFGSVSKGAYILCRK